MNEKEREQFPSGIVTMILNRNFNDCKKGDKVDMFKLPYTNEFWVQNSKKETFKVYGKDYQWFDYPKKTLMDLQW